MFHTLNEKQRNSLIGGAGLIVIALFVFAAQLMKTEAMGWVITGGLALIFLGWGILTRQSAFFIPAGILGGVAVGIWLTLTTLDSFSNERSGALMVASLAVGFAAITVLSIVFTQVRHLWALIVAAILGIVAAALWIGGAALNLLTLVGQAWPLTLIIIGGVIIWRVLRKPA